MSAFAAKKLQISLLEGKDALLCVGVVLSKNVVVCFVRYVLRTYESEAAFLTY